MADIYLTNTLTRKKEKFEPINDKKVNLFVCGPTVYDYPHIGNAKTYTQFDFLVRFLRYSGFVVFYLQNITDIDDKILNRSSELGIDWKELTTKYEGIYMENMGKLNNISVTKYARATDYIEQIVKQVKTLMEKGYAYTIDDGIYFEISKFPNYGKLSGRTELKQEDSISRIDENTQKRGWNDFCLWKFSKPDEPSWKTEIGEGRPGWHIEDTAITQNFFGPQYDIHGGAVDLIIPHHEAEIAQMESASGKKPLVKYWLHTAFLMVDGKKMSKSLGNFYTIDDVIKKGFDPIALRYLFLGANYRETMNFTWDSLQAAQNGLERLRNQVSSLKTNVDRTVLSEEKEEKVNDYRDRFLEALSDDLSTPKALAVLWDMLKSNIPSEDKYDLAMSFDEILGLKLSEIPNSKNQIPDNIQTLIDQREKLRKEGKYEEADKIRNQIQELGFNISDKPLK
ncbi:MAG TPA: cysteine--tRNA ligase [Candidatus Saccharimonadales bacterium]|nr:cysteine--tRNA ligase [Candidatus Saccharimonadales bacterium]